jgi:hypothetical protein
VYFQSSRKTEVDILVHGTYLSMIHVDYITLNSKSLLIGRSLMVVSEYRIKTNSVRPVTLVSREFVI